MLSRLFVLLLLLSPATPATARAAGHLGMGDGGTQRCDVVTMEADDATCGDTTCRLEGHARLRCDALTLWADTMDVQLTDTHAFAGAVAQGHVLLVEGVKVVTCKQIVLEEDRIRGQVEAATIQVRRSDAVRDPNGVPVGGNQAIMHGTIERLDQSRLRLTHADFTLCDCADTGPSWRLDTREVEATVGERVILWGPQVRLNLNPFGELMVPITPPLAPLSLPLQRRALGFLMLRPTFLAPPWPTLDLPFFIPLGDSWDITLTPGIRTDWGRHSRPFKINTVGAPRLGARLRWAPWAGVHGSASVQLTHDTSQVQATLERGEATGPIADDLFARRIALVDRVSVEAQQRARLADHLDWVMDVRWLSDDLVLRDFSLAVTEQFSTYWPSRTEVLWRLPSFSALAAADFMLRFDNSEVVDGVRLPVYSNSHGGEAGTLHRGPFLQAALAPTSLGGGLSVDGSLSFVRYGTWSDQPGHLSADAADPVAQAQNIGGLTAGIGYANALGPLRLSARTGADLLLVGLQDAPLQLDTAWLGSAEVALPLAGRPAQGSWVHTVTPTLLYRAIPGRWLAGTRLGADATPPFTIMDERRLRRIGHQGMLLLRQALWAPRDAGMPTWNLDIGQPFDLLHGAILQPWADLQFYDPVWGNAHLFTSIDLHQLDELPVRELSASYGVRTGPLEFSAAYDRLAPNADRFSRGIYELAAPWVPLAGPPPPDKAALDMPSNWVHVLSGGITVRYNDLLELGYSTTYQLPRPGLVGGEPACATPAQTIQQQTQGGPLQAPSSCFISHSVRLVYRSPCKCWGVAFQLSAQAQNFGETLHFSIVPDIAGYHF